MLPKIHGMQVDKLEGSFIKQRCPTCPYSSPVKGVIDGYHCDQNVLEGPLYHTDGCDLVECMRIYQGPTVELRVTEGSTVVGETDDPSAEKPAPVPTPETREWKAGDKVKLLKWDLVFNGASEYVMSTAQLEYSGEIGRLYRVTPLRAGDETVSLQISGSSATLMWPRYAIKLISPAEDLKTYRELKRVHQAGERALIVRPNRLGDWGEELVGKVVKITTAGFETPEGDQYGFNYGELTPLDQ